MMRRFSSGSVDALEPREEAVGGVDVDERDVEVALERLDDLGRLVLAQQAVVDEDAGELVADRLVDEQRRDRRVDAAGERAEDALLPTWARMRSTCSSITAAGVHVGRAPATP